MLENISLNWKKFILLLNLGLIEQDEMLEILTSLRSTDGPDCSENVFKMFQTLDGDGDGQISEEEFEKTFEQTKTQ